MGNKESDNLKIICVSPSQSFIQSFPKKSLGIVKKCSQKFCTFKKKIERKAQIFIFAADKEEITVSHYVLENWEYLVQG